MPDVGDKFTIVSARERSYDARAQRKTRSEIRSYFWEHSEELSCVSLHQDDRSGHLQKLLRNLVLRLPFPQGSKAPISTAARLHGELRSRQGSTAPMVVKESRLLQASICGTLQKNLSSVEFSQVLLRRDHRGRRSGFAIESGNTWLRKSRPSTGYPGASVRREVDGSPGDYYCAMAVPKACLTWGRTRYHKIQTSSAITTN